MFPASWKWNSSAILAMAVVLKSSSISDSEAKIEYSGSHTASWGPPSGLQYASQEPQVLQYPLGTNVIVSPSSFSYPGYAYFG